MAGLWVEVIGGGGEGRGEGRGEMLATCDFWYKTHSPRFLHRIAYDGKACCLPAVAFGQFSPDSM